MQAARAVLLLAGCGMFLFVALVIGVGVALYFAFRGRVLKTLGPPAQAVAILENWAADEGCELLKADWLEDRRDHPFADRFGVGWGKRPAIVLVVKVRTPQGQVRQGWAYLQYRGLRSRTLLPDSLEVAWDQ